jgi:hypothetical protein
LKRDRCGIANADNGVNIDLVYWHRTTKRSQNTLGTWLCIH